MIRCARTFVLCLCAAACAGAADDEAVGRDAAVAGLADGDNEAAGEPSLVDFLPPAHRVIAFEGGVEFEVGRYDPRTGAETWPAAMPGAGAPQDGYRLRVDGLLFDEQYEIEAGQLVGRSSRIGDWHERWSVPMPLLVAAPEPGARPIVQDTSVNTPIGSSRFEGGSVLALAWCRSGGSREFDGVPGRDLLELVIEVAHDRADLGVGERRLRFWLQRGVGPLAIEIDGITFARRSAE